MVSLESRRTTSGQFDDVVEGPRVSLVIPTLNEEKNLPYVLPLVPDWVHEIIVVDGFSGDDTITVARDGHPKVRIMTVDEPGKGVAMRAGFLASEGDIIVSLDADGSTDPREIPAFVGSLISGADVAMGSRFAVGGGTSDMELFRRTGNWVLTQAVRLTFGARYSDLCYGYFAFWRDIFPLLDGPFTGFDVETVMHIRAVRAGLRIAEVPSFEARRIWGESNLRTIRDGSRVLRAIGREWRLSRLEPPAGDLERFRATRSARMRHPSWGSYEETVDLEELVTEDLEGLAL